MRVPARLAARATSTCPAARPAHDVAAASSASASRRRPCHGGDVTGPLVVGRVLT